MPLLLSREAEYTRRFGQNRMLRGFPQGEETHMLWTLIVLLMLFWILGFAFHVAGGIIHVLLVIALVLFLVQLITGRRTVV